VESRTWRDIKELKMIGDVSMGHSANYTTSSVSKLKITINCFDSLRISGAPRTVTGVKNELL
jgi:hypothetical protein